MHSKGLDVGTVHFNDAPIIGASNMPQTGRGRSSKVLKGANRHVLRKYCNLKSLSIFNW